MEKKLYDLTVSEELEHLIPPLQDMELKMLTESLLANGCEMPLVVWDRTIVDGHNRYRICREHGIPFAIEEKEFENMDAAKVWLIKNQLGRRNLPDFVKCELVIPLEEILKAEADKRKRAAISDFRKGASRSEMPPKLAASQETRDTLASMAGVSHGTLGKAKKIIESANEDVKDKLRKGDVSIHKAYTDIRKAEQAPAESLDETPTVSASSDAPSKERPKYESLLKKPIFDRNQPPCTVEGVIPFEPIVSEATMAAFEAAKEKEDVDQNAIDGEDPNVDSPADTTDTVEQDVQELIDDFLADLTDVLDGVDSVDAERILAMVRDAGERAVHTVEIYMKKMEV